MPFITIKLFEGRSEAQKEAIARDVTEVVAKHALVSKDNVFVFIEDMPEGTYFPHGEKKTR